MRKLLNCGVVASDQLNRAGTACARPVLSGLDTMHFF